MYRRYLLGAVATLPLAVGLAGPAFADYPERPIEMIVPWGAGGGSDAVARIIASLMEEELGQPINVVNRAGGSGAVGHQAIASATPDGYTIGMLTLEITTMHWVGFSELTSAEFTPLGQVNVDPSAITVAADAPWQTAIEFLDDVVANPGTYHASGGGAGSFGHIALSGLSKLHGATGDALPWVTLDSAAAAQQELLAGGIDVVGSSLGETRTLRDAERTRTLAIMADEPLIGFEEIPTLKSMGIDWSYGTWRGFAGPPGLPDDVTERLGEALKNAYDSDTFREFMENNGFGMYWRDGAEFAEFMAAADVINGEVLKDIGLAE